MCRLHWIVLQKSIRPCQMLIGTSSRTNQFTLLSPHFCMFANLFNSSFWGFTKELVGCALQRNSNADKTRWRHLNKLPKIWQKQEHSSTLSPETKVKSQEGPVVDPTIPSWREITGKAEQRPTPIMAMVVFVVMVLQQLPVPMPRSAPCTISLPGVSPDQPPSLLGVSFLSLFNTFSSWNVLLSLIVICFVFLVSLHRSVRYNKGTNADEQLIIVRDND